MESNQIRLMSYRNGYYQGQVKSHQKNGYGILIVDQGPLIVGRWKDDLLEGSALAFLTAQEHGVLQFNRGELDGTCIFRTNGEALVVKMSGGQPIERQLLMSQHDSHVKVMAYRSGAYQTLDTLPLDQRSLSVLVSDLLGMNIVIPSPTEFIQQHFCNIHQFFELKTLSNGTLQLTYREPSSPLSIGFVMNKNDQLMSKGCYVGDKLQGMGSKFENGGRLEGEFNEGGLHGMGLKLSANKYSFGRFDNGSLVDAIFMEERSSASEEKLIALKRAQHIQSPHFFNGYVKDDPLQFRGITEVTSVPSGVKDLLYGVAAISKRPSSPDALIRSGASLNQILSGSKLREQQRSPALEAKGETQRKGLGGLLASREGMSGSSNLGRRFG